MQRFAVFLSYILHPLLIQTYIVLFLLFSNAYFAYSIPGVVQKFLIGTVFVITFLFPVVSTLFMVKRGMIQSLQLQSQHERFFPFLIAAVYYFACYFFIKKLPVPPLFYVIQFGAACSILITLLINLRWKISVHMIGVGGFAGTLFSVSHIIYVNYILAISVVIILSGLLGFSRLLTGNHTQSQLYLGFVCGFLCEYVSLHYYLF
jgi:hypothetical protein